MEISTAPTADTEPAHTSIPDDVPAVTSERFITFELGGNTYAMIATSVMEISRQLTVSPVPNSPRYLSGIAPLRDEVVAVVNLRGLLDAAPAGDANAKPKHVVMNRWTGDGTHIGFLVDRVGEIAQIEIGSIRPTPGESELMIGAAVDGSRTLKIIDHRKLAAARFLD